MTLAHTDVAAYTLGLLEADDHRAFEAHVGQCGLCAAELGNFSGMRSLFEGVDPVEEPGGNVVDMFRHPKGKSRRRKVGTALASVAAASALVAGGVTAGSVVSDEEPGRPQPSAAEQLFNMGERRSASDASSGASGTVAMQTKGWGTQVALKLSNVRGPLECDLIAVGRGGKERFVSGWTVPDQGYGASAPLLVHGATAIQRDNLSHFEVRVKGGRNLLKIPV